jgi:predicted acylesterase/phospholipase RssA
MYKNIILSAGALSCFVHLGIYKYLYENNLLNDLEIIVGTSGGSIASLIFVLKPSYNDIKKILYLILKYGNLKKYFDFKVNSIYDLINNFGIIDKRFIYKIISIILIYLKIDKNITFLELYKLYPIKLIITGTNLTNSNCDIFSFDITPNMKIIDAISISCAIPILFKPILYNNCYYIDGGILRYFPYDIIINENSINNNPNIINETLAISIILHDFNINNILKFILYLMFLVSNNNIYNNNYYNKYNNIFFYYEKLDIFDFLKLDLKLYYKIIDIIEKASNKFEIYVNT